jgi:membrane-bound ClpP family serine protease
VATNVSRGTAPAVATVGTPTLWIMGGLVVAVLGGILGSFFDPGDDMQLILYSLASVGGTIAGMLLLVRHARAGLDLSAAGFGALGVLAVAGAVLGFTGAGSEGVFVSMAILHWPAVWLIAAQDWAPVWSRGAAAVSGLLFALWGYTTSLGDEPIDTESPLAIASWVAFTIAAVGWLMTLRAEGDNVRTGA